MNWVRQGGSTTFETNWTPFTRAKKIGTARQIFGTVPRLSLVSIRFKIFRDDPDDWGDW